MNLNTDPIDTDFEVSSLANRSETGKRPATWNLRFLVAGMIFGIILVKSEVVSWFRIQEMFRFQSFHMFGVIGSAVATGMLSVFLIKKYKVKTFEGDPVLFQHKPFHKGNIFGGLLFGAGWALTGACPGPLFAIIGTGGLVIAVALLGAIAGTWCYGALQNRLPH